MKCKFCNNEAVQGKRACQDCLNKLAKAQLDYANKRKADHLCVDCGKPVNAGTYCDVCREKRKELARQRYKKNRSAGTCSNCGKPTEIGYRLCPKCLQLHSKIRKKREVNSPVYQSKVRDNFKCRLCGETKRIHTHHIDENGERVKDPGSKKMNPQANNSLENLITLCISCHSAITRLLSRNPELAIQLLRKVKLG